MDKNFILGALFSKPDVRDYVAKTKQSEFPTEFELKMPKVKNQEKINSCVAHALATTLEYFNQAETGEYKQMSTGYIYGNRRFMLHKGSGMYTKDALKTVSKYGDVPNELFPVNIEVPEVIECFESEVDKIEEQGYFFKIGEYFKLNNEAAIKTSLMENGPVIMSMKWFSDIKVVDGVMKTRGDGPSCGGHCMVIYGWNKTGWKVRNSWGYGFGDEGNVVIPYSVPIKEIWGVRDASADSSLIIKKPFSTKFGQKVAKVLNNAILFVYNLVHKK